MSKEIFTRQFLKLATKEQLVNIAVKLSLENQKFRDGITVFLFKLQECIDVIKSKTNDIKRIKK